MTPQEAGRLTGSLILPLAALAGMVKCWLISRRPTTNKKCAFALFWVLLCVLTASNLTLATRWLGPTPWVAAIGALAGFVILGAMVTALVLAILGLQEIAAQPGRFRQGKAQAIGTLVVFGLLIGMAIIGMVAGINRQSVHTFKVNPGAVTRFEAENFEFSNPGSPWHPMDMTKINKEAKLTIMRQFPEVYFSIVANPIGQRMELTAAQFADLGKNHMRALAGDTMHVLGETPLVINGLPGLLEEMEAQVGGQMLYYRQWYAMTNGYSYELVAWGRSDNRERVTEETQPLLYRFKQIDPGRLAPTTGQGTATNYVSLHYHFAARMDNSAWHHSATLAKNCPYAEFTVSQGDSCLEVTPVWLGSQKASLEAVTAGLLATLGVAYGDDNLTRLKHQTNGGPSEVWYGYTREVDGTTFHYRFKIMATAQEACLVAAWTQRKAGTETLLNDALDRVTMTVDPTTATDPTHDFSAGERKAQGFILNQMGLHYQKAGEAETALPWFCAAALANPEEATFAQNALLAWRELDRPTEALAFLARQPADFQALPAVRADEAWFQAEASRPDQAITNYAAVFAAGYHDQGQFKTYIALLNQQRLYDRALTEVHHYLETEDSLAVRLLEPGIYLQKKDYPQAIKLLKAQRDDAPDNAQISRELAEACIQAGQYSEALEIARGLQEKNGGSVADDFLRGQCELGLKWYREAKQSFDAAAALTPANKEIRSYQDLVASLLGEGNNSLVREVIEPVDFPASLTNSPLPPVPQGYATNYGAYYDRRIVALSYQPGKERKTTEVNATRVLDAYGVSAFSTVQVGFDPLNEEVYVNDLRVLDPQGKVVSVGNPDNYYVLDDHTSESASQAKILNIPVSGLQPNDELEVTITRRSLGRLEQFPFFEHSFAATFPARESLLFFAGDTTGLKYRSSPALEPVKFPTGLCWTLNEPPPARWEPLQPPPASFLPMLWIGDAAAQWPEVASNYLASISDRLAPDSSVQDLARTLAGAATNEEDKIAIMSRYVQTNYIYKAIEFGRRSRIPNRPAEIIQNKYGDCKDHAVLLQQLLAAAGVHAQLALVNTRDLIQPDMPSLDQFNHMIVLVTNRQGNHYLDCTAKGADVVRSLPYGQAGREALILDPQHPHFNTLPAYAQNASDITAQLHVRLVDKTDLAEEEMLTLNGITATGMRQLLAQIPEATLKSTLLNQFGMTDVQLEDVHVENLNDPQLPLRLTFNYTRKKQFHEMDDRLTGAVRAGFARFLLAPVLSGDRQTPFETMIPTHFHNIITIEPPAGFQVEMPEALAISLDSRFATGSVQTRMQGGNLEMEFAGQWTAGRFPAKDYPEFLDTINKALTLIERTVAFKPAAN